MDTFKRLLIYLRPHRPLFVLCLGLVGMLSALELVKPWPLKLMVDQIISGKPLTVWGYYFSPRSFSLAV
jgi:ATP-binding cassette subfamily B protein/subfamily B ATP-binding cassette protein MsbA